MTDYSLFRFPITATPDRSLLKNTTLGHVPSQEVVGAVIREIFPSASKEIPNQKDNHL